jgi:SdpC family antimicrobial peptide
MKKINVQDSNKTTTIKPGFERRILAHRLARAIRAINPRSLCSALLAISLATGSVTGCDDAEGPASIDQASSLAELSGEEIYLGLFLGKGEAASLLPEVYDGVAVAEKLRNPESILIDLRQAQARRAAEGDERGAKLLQDTIDMVEGGVLEGQVVDGMVVNDSLAATFVHQVSLEDPEFFDHFAGEIRSGDPRRVEQALADASAVSQRVADELAFKSDGMQARASLAVVKVVAIAMYAFVVLVEGFWIVVGQEARSKSGSNLLRDELVVRVTEAFAPR